MHTSNKPLYGLASASRALSKVIAPGKNLTAEFVPCLRVDIGVLDRGWQPAHESVNRRLQSLSRTPDLADGTHHSHSHDVVANRCPSRVHLVEIVLPVGSLLESVEDVVWFATPCYTMG